MTSYCVSSGSIDIVAAGFGSLGWVWVPGVPGGGCGPGGQEVFGGGRVARREKSELPKQDILKIKNGFEKELKLDLKV